MFQAAVESLRLLCTRTFKPANGRNSDACECFRKGDLHWLRFDGAAGGGRGTGDGASGGSIDNNDGERKRET
jgi:hypothetical protein